MNFQPYRLQKRWGFSLLTIKQRIMDKERVFRVAVEDTQSFKDEMRRCGIRYAFNSVIPNYMPGMFNYYYVGMDEYSLVNPDYVTPGEHKCWEDYV